MTHTRGLRAILWAVAFSAVAAGASSAPPAIRTFVRGIVVISGRPARSVWVTAGQGGREKNRSLTGDDGRYYIGNLEPGRYDIAVVNGNNQLFKGQVSLPMNGTYDIRIK